MLSFQYNDNKYYKNNQTKNEEKPASGQNKVRADIFDRFFGGLPFRFRFLARRAERGRGGNSARRAQPVPFGYFQTDTALRGRKHNFLSLTLRIDNFLSA